MILIRRFLEKHSPTILTVFSVAGLISTVVLAVKATPKAVQIIEGEQYYRESVDKEETPTLEKVKLVYPCYLPAAIMGGITIACIVNANSINLKRNAALATLYSISETALKEYQSKIVETIGKGKAQTIKDTIYEGKLKKNPVSERNVIVTGRGDTLCYDDHSGRYFKSDIENIRKKQNDVNRDLLFDGYVSLNDVYYALGLSNTKLGYQLGWKVEDGQIEFKFSSHLAEDGTPCLVIDYEPQPKIGYN